MKMKKIAAICAANKTVILYTDPLCPTQWISDGSAVYPLVGLPDFNETSIFKFLDVPDDKQHKFYYKENRFPASYSLEDTLEDETPIEDKVPFALRAFGRVLLPLKTSQGTIFIDREYLKPFDDIEDGVILYERRDTEGNPYIAVKAGILLVGIILPMRFETSFIDDLESVADDVRKAAENGISAYYTA